jgi:hypothetical protein
MTYQYDPRKNNPTPEEFLDYISSKTPEESEYINLYIKQNGDNGFTLEELDRSLSHGLEDYRQQLAEIERQDFENSPAGFSTKVRNAMTLEEKEKLLTEKGLYQNPKQHYFQGKPLPVKENLTTRHRSEILEKDFKRPPMTPRESYQKYISEKQTQEILAFVEQKKKEGMPKNWGGKKILGQGEFREQSPREILGN